MPCWCFDPLWNELFSAERACASLAFWSSALMPGTTHDRRSIHVKILTYIVQRESLRDGRGQNAGRMNDADK